MPESFQSEDERKTERTIAIFIEKDSSSIVIGDSRFHCCFLLFWNTSKKTCHGRKSLTCPFDICSVGRKIVLPSDDLVDCQIGLKYQVSVRAFEYTATYFESVRLPSCGLPHYFRCSSKAHCKTPASGDRGYLQETRNSR